MKKNQIFTYTAVAVTSGVLVAAVHRLAKRHKKVNKYHGCNKCRGCTGVDLLLDCKDNTPTVLDYNDLINVAENGYDIWIDSIDPLDPDLIISRRVTPYVSSLIPKKYVIVHIDRSTYTLTVMGENEYEAHSNL